MEFLFLNSGAFRRRFRQKNCSLTLTSLAAFSNRATCCYSGTVALMDRGWSRAWTGDGARNGQGRKKKKAAQAPDRASHFTSRFVAVPWLSPRGPAKRVGFNSPGAVAQRLACCKWPRGLNNIFPVFPFQDNTKSLGRVSRNLRKPQVPSFAIWAVSRAFVFGITFSSRSWFLQPCRALVRRDPATTPLKQACRTGSPSFKFWGLPRAFPQNAAFVCLKCLACVPVLYLRC